MSDLGLDMNALTSFSGLGLPGTFENENGGQACYEPLELTPVRSNPEDRNQDLLDDYETARQTIHFQNQMMMDAAKIYLEIAKNSESPKFLQAFGTLMQQMNANSREFLNLHKDMKKILEDDKKKDKNQPVQQSPVNIQNATVFMGSPSDLMDEIDDQEQGLIIEGELA